MENKSVVTTVGTIAAGVCVAILGTGAVEVFNSHIWDSSDYLLLAFIAAIISSVCYNIAGKK